MTEVARGAGVTREALYKALNKKGDPKLTTLTGVFNTLNIRLQAAPAGSAQRTITERAGRKKSATIMRQSFDGKSRPSRKAARTKKASTG